MLADDVGPAVLVAPGEAGEDAESALEALADELGATRLEIAPQTSAVSAEPEYVTRLEREAVASSRIEHPNIVEVVNLDETEDGHVFLVAELLDGCDQEAETLLAGEARE